MIIYWLPSNGAITQCGRKAHAIKAGRTSRVQHNPGVHIQTHTRVRTVTVQATPPITSHKPHPSTYVPHTVRIKGKATHIPFTRPHTYQPQFKPSKVTNLQRLSGYMEPTTERTYPFANHNAPWAADLLTPPYLGRITIKSDPPPKEEQKSLASVMIFAGFLPFSF